jgi:hypothetical protein
MTRRLSGFVSLVIVLAGAIICLAGLARVGGNLMWSAPEVPLIGVGLDDESHYFGGVGPVGASQVTIVEVYSNQLDFFESAGEPMWRITRMETDERSDQTQFVFGERPTGWVGEEVAPEEFAPGNILLMSNGCYFSHSEVPPSSPGPGEVSLAPGLGASVSGLNTARGFRKCDDRLVPTEARWLFAIGLLTIASGAVLFIRYIRLREPA